MRYPSLIFAEEKGEKVMDNLIISDLKLDLLMPESVTDYLLYRPEKETFLLRREMFGSLLEDGDKFPKLGEMRESLYRASELYKALNRAVSENAAAYILVFLFSELLDFCKKAADFPESGKLFERFKKVFAETLGDEGFVKATGDAEVVKTKLDVITSVVMECSGDEAKLSRKFENGIADSLKACAHELGIELTGKAARKFRLQKGIAEGMAKLYPEEFAEARAFYNEHRWKVKGDVFDYLPEMDFILGILEFTEKAKAAGIPYSFPSLSEEKKFKFSDVYDITLLMKPGTTIVPNDVSFDPAEPFYYLTGANGGGKTTYLRAVGNAALLFLAGAPVFCKGGEASLLSAVFTHFPRDERFEGSGRFLDEKTRADEILAKEGGNSLVLLNETYATTGEDKAIVCTSELANKLYESGSFGLYITHQHEISEKRIPFLGVMIDETDSNRRTYRIEKRRLPPRSFAADILEKYGLTEEALKTRLLINKG